MPQDPKMLTHEQMRQIILKGGSVLHNGQVYNNVNQLPPPESLVDNPADQAKLLGELEAEEAKLKARREALTTKSFAKSAETGGVDESKQADEDEFKRLAAENDAKAKAAEAGAKRR